MKAKKSKDEVKVKDNRQDECQKCEHLENARDYFHEELHKEQDKVKVLVATVAMLSEALKDANETIEMLQEDN